MNLDFSLLANGSLAALHTKQPDYRLAIAEGKLQWLSPHQLEERQAKASVAGEEAPILVAIDTIAQSVLQGVQSQMPQDPDTLDLTLQNLEWINGKLEKHNENLHWRHSIRLFLCNFFRKLIGFEGLDYQILDLTTIRQAKEHLEHASSPLSPKPTNNSNPIPTNAQIRHIESEEERLESIISSPLFQDFHLEKEDHELLTSYFSGKSFFADQELDIRQFSLSPNQWKMIAILLEKDPNRTILQELESYPQAYLAIGKLEGWPTNEPVPPTLTALQHTFNQLAYFPDYAPKGISLPLFFIHNNLGPTAETTRILQSPMCGNAVIKGFPGYELLIFEGQAPTIRCLISNEQGLQVYNYYTIPNQSPYWWITTTTFECFAPNDVANIERAQRTEVVMLACRGQHHIQQLFNHSSWTDTSNNQNFFRNTSYHNSGTWASPIHPVSSLPESNRLVMALDLVHGVMNLHAKDWLHCDLKPANILLERTWGFDQQLLIRASIGNLGLACVSTESKPRPIQDFESCPIPPEAMEGNAPWTQAADNWSVGILLLQLFYPDYYLKEFGEKSGIELRKALVKWANQENRLPDDVEPPIYIKDTILGLTDTNPTERFDLYQAWAAIFRSLLSSAQEHGETWTLVNGSGGGAGGNHTLQRTPPSPPTPLEAV